MTAAAPAPVASDASGPAAAGRRTPPGAGVLAVASILVCAVAMPVVYGLVAFHGALAPALKAPILQHIAFNCLANATVMLGAIGLEGRFDQRLGQVFARTALAHGALAFLTLITRHYYSIPMMLVAVPSSAALGTAVTALRRRGARLEVGIVGPSPAPAPAPDVNFVRVQTPSAQIRGFDLLLIAFDGDPPAEWAPVLSRALLAGKRVRHLAEYAEEARGMTDIDRFDLDHLPAAGLTSYRAGKRALDLIAALAALPLALPAVALAALAVIASMGRPAFFVQTRVGQGGRVFRMIKLRTMRPLTPGDADVATARRDPRVTPLGRWLRRFHIDELPQLWNVVVGDMSLVGPRPEQPALAEGYARQVPAFAWRQLVRPGITGWAQVRAPYAADLAETRVKLGYDLFYLKNLSLALDVQILARTLWTIVGGKGVR
ncbi:MAG: sugar transferase [Caulobacteraceae bacterium]